MFRNPERGVMPRPCVVCGVTFQPYRRTTETCSMKCYRRLPRVAAANAAIKARPEVKARRNKARRLATNPERQIVNRKWALHRYGLSIEEYEQRLAEQGGVCHLCGKPPKPGGVRSAARLHVDHNHITGAVRKLLCLNCNRGIGYLGDDPDLIERAAAYVRSFA